ncbi:hypothetical protein ULMA_28360 [Patiriisocius marinus]|uniref:Uncharacterized protein n=1 Tax=Patiriisocius marinus TaxID=1397112 RepID=A0A5J4J3W8_9FLAO|nr:hypothetical protein [Patiriisocius marinus]GER60728.1 hypothetical protein ULMA_28360 [Patiriisocius marinus]
MTKTDKSKHKISIASIKRSTYKPYDYKLTKFHESNSDFPYSKIKLDLKENELIICSTFIDSENYSILTTQKLITKENGIENVGNMIGATDKRYGDFKGFKDDLFTFGLVELENGTDLKYFIETGKASMIMIYGVRTLIRTQHMTEKNIENTTRNWNRQNEKNEK